MINLARLALALIILVYPTWSLIAVWLEPSMVDPIAARALASAPAALLLALDRLKPGAWTSRLSELTFGCILVMTIHYFHVANVNRLHLVYFIGSFILVVSVVAMLGSRRQLQVYSLVVLAAAVLVSRHESGYIGPFYVAAITTVLIVGYVGTAYRFRLIEAEYRARKELEENQAMLAGSARLSALGEMAGGIAHEINTPLATIALEAAQTRELIEEGEKDSSVLLRKVGVIVSVVDRIARIVRGLRAFARDGAADRFDRVPVATLVEDALALCRARLTQGQVEVRLDVPTELGVECRAVQISQCLLNLIGNAYDALQESSEKVISISARREGDESVIDVADTGPGVPADLRDKIFQPFFTTKEIGKGTGLGLSISQGLIRSHGGRLELAPSPKGAIFRIRLPISQASAQ